MDYLLKIMDSGFRDSRWGGGGERLGSPETVERRRVVDCRRREFRNIVFQQFRGRNVGAAEDAIGRKMRG